EPHTLAGARSARQRLGEQALEERPVGQAREAVLMRQLADLLLRPLARRDVARDAAIAAKMAGLVEDRHAAGAEPGVAAGAAADIFELAEGLAPTEDRLVHPQRRAVDIG